MKKGSYLVIIGILMLITAIALSVYNYWDSYRAGKVSEDKLSKIEYIINKNKSLQMSGVNNSSKNDDVELNIERPDYILAPERPLPEENLDGDVFVGVLSLNTIGKEFPVLSEFNYKNVKNAPCRYSGSPYLDNLVICAHNYRSHFGRIGNLKIGDIITFTDVQGNVFIYHVSEICDIFPDTVQLFNDETNWDLTLFTCTLSGRKRTTVRCNRTSD